MLAAHLVEAGWLLQNLPTVRNFEGSVLGFLSQAVNKAIRLSLPKSASFARKAVANEPSLSAS